MGGSVLVVCCGLPGVGKSTVSEYLANQLAATRYRTDEVRYDLFDDPEYTPAEMHRTYDELLDRARTGLQAGEDVVVDGTFKRARERDRVARVGEETGATVRFVRVTCPSAVVCERIESRTGDASDADVGVYREHRDQFEPLGCAHITVDNGGDLSKTRRQVDEGVLSTLD